MPAGRPPEYRKAYAKIVYRLGLLGYTEAQMAAELPCSLANFKKFKTQVPEFAAAVKASKGRADGLVTRALLKRALGFRYQLEEEKIGAGGQVQTLTQERYQPPDVTACIFWLKNRQRALWFDSLAVSNMMTKSPDEAAADLREATRQIRAMEGLEDGTA